MHKTLIIDDDSLNLRSMSAMFQHFEFQVYSSLRGDEGIELAKQISPDLILIDLFMPKATYDGVETTRLLRNIPQFQVVPIVAVSAADAQTIRELVVNGQFTDYLQKPITIDKVKQLLVRLNQQNTV